MNNDTLPLNPSKPHVLFINPIIFAASTFVLMDTETLHDSQL
jgi:hypothetical protein